VIRDLLGGRDDDRGFSLIEVVVAMVIFGIMVTAALGILVNTLSVTKDNAHRVAAANLATKQIESARSQLAIDIPDGATSRTETVAGTDYTITQDASYAVSGSEESLCQNGGGQLAYKLVTVTVQWPDMGSVKPVRSDTIKAVGIGAEGLDEALGALAIGVIGATGDPVAGVVVSLAPGNLTRTTGANGCAVFVNLPVDAGGTEYKASVNQIGFVGPQNTQYQEVAVDALAGQIRGGDLLKYDRERTLTLQVSEPAGYTLPAGEIPVGVRSSDIDTGVTLASCASVISQGCTTGTPGYALHLFPAIYDVWTGDCSSPRPAGASGTVDLITTDGTVSLPVERAWIRVVDGLGTPVPGYAVTAASELAAGCASGQSHDLPSTGTDGSRGALPAGRWTIAVTSPLGATSVQSVVLDPAGDMSSHTVTFVVAS